MGRQWIIQPRHRARSLALLALVVLLAAAAPTAAASLPRRPFASQSIWNRRVPSTATFADVQAALFGDPAAAPNRIGLDIVTLCAVDPDAPPTNVERSAGWTQPLRQQSTGQVLYVRPLAADACLDVAWNPIGNALFVLFDPRTGLADLGIGGWRVAGGPLLNSAPDGSSAHGLDVRRGDGLIGYGRASGLPALGGLLRAGELRGHIRHAVAVVLNSTRYAANPHFVWPARSADGSANVVYAGSDPHYTMGTLLAIPPAVPVRTLPWRTRQGRALAFAAQRYGWYIVDSVLADQIQFAIDAAAARQDLGLSIDAGTGAMSVDPSRVDAVGLEADVHQILGLLQAVTSNVAP